VREFFSTYYHPANASLTLAGDIEPDAAFELAERYFGDIPAAPVPAPVIADATLARSTRIMMEDRIELPRLYLAWHSPAMFAQDDAELDLAADLIAHGKTSRLYKTLVYDRRIATDVVAYQHSREISGLFQIATTAAPGVGLSELHALVLAALDELARQQPSTAELERARAQTDAQFIYRLQTIGGFGGKSDQLNAYNVFRGDPSYFAEDRARYEQATPQSITAALGRWIVGAPMVALSVVPKGAQSLALADSTEVHVS
jgi:zinc protease